MNTASLYQPLNEVPQGFSGAHRYVHVIGTSVFVDDRPDETCNLGTRRLEIVFPEVGRRGPCGDHGGVGFPLGRLTARHVGVGR